MSIKNGHTKEAEPGGAVLARRKGIDFAYITLHAGLGNFRDIDVEDLTKHKTDSEQMIVNEEAVRIVNHAKDLPAATRNRGASRRNISCAAHRAACESPPRFRPDRHKRGTCCFSLC